MEISIRLIEQFDSSFIPHINTLLGQLTLRQIDFNEESLRQIVASPANRLFILYADGQVAGMLTLGIYHSPTGCKLWIEDVVIDTLFRGNGLGHKLIQHAVNYARNYAPCDITLTSNPQRIEANKLYKSEGFEQRCTNVYKMPIK